VPKKKGIMHCKPTKWWQHLHIHKAKKVMRRGL
jgi:hypothetical protein